MPLEAAQVGCAFVAAQEGRQSIQVTAQRGAVRLAHIGHVELPAQGSGMILSEDTLFVGFDALRGSIVALAQGLGPFLSNQQIAHGERNDREQQQDNHCRNGRRHDAAVPPRRS